MLKVDSDLIKQQLPMTGKEIRLAAGMEEVGKSSVQSCQDLVCKKSV
jgi:hypothetical protein